MKTFLAVLAVLVVATVLSLKLKAQRDRENQAHEIEDVAFIIAAAECKDAHGARLQEVEDQLLQDEHRVGELLGYDAENRFDSQLHERGCFQPAPPLKANKRRK